MSRRGSAVKRYVQQNLRYNSEDLAKFTNHLMKDGKKSVAERIIEEAFALVKLKIKNAEPIEVFQRALSHIAPRVEVKSRRVGGATYQVPNEVSTTRAKKLAMCWLIMAAKTRSEHGMPAKLAAEMVDAADEDSTTGGSKGKGGAIKKREDTHKMAEANRAFSHYRY